MNKIVQKVMTKTVMIDMEDECVAVSGDINRQVGRRKLCLVFEYWFRQYPHFVSPIVAAYDAAETFYIGSSHMPNQITEETPNLIMHD